MLHLAGFIVIYEAFLGIEPYKDLFQRVFEVKTRKAHGSDGGMLAPVGEMNIQICYGASYNYPCLSLRSFNSGWHGNWFYIHDNVAAPLPQFSIAVPARLESWNWGCEWSQLKKVLEILRIVTITQHTFADTFYSGQRVPFLTDSLSQKVLPTV